MKKLFIISILLAVSFTYVAAQQGGVKRSGYKTPEEQAEDRVNKLTPVLSLTAEQKTKIKAIEIDLIKQQNEKIMKMLGDLSAQMALSEEFRKLREEKYKSALTADQFKRYKEYNTPLPLKQQ